MAVSTIIHSSIPSKLLTTPFWSRLSFSNSSFQASPNYCSLTSSLVFLSLSSPTISQCLIFLIHRLLIMYCTCLNQFSLFLLISLLIFRLVNTLFSSYYPYSAVLHWAIYFPLRFTLPCTQYDLIFLSGTVSHACITTCRITVI